MRLYGFFFFAPTLFTTRSCWKRWSDRTQQQHTYTNTMFPWKLLQPSHQSGSKPEWDLQSVWVQTGPSPGSESTGTSVYLQGTNIRPEPEPRVFVLQVSWRISGWRLDLLMMTMTMMMEDWFWCSVCSGVAKVKTTEVINSIHPENSFPLSGPQFGLQFYWYLQIAPQLKCWRSKYCRSRFQTGSDWTLMKSCKQTWGKQPAALCCHPEAVSWHYTKLWQEASSFSVKNRNRNVTASHWEKIQNESVFWSLWISNILISFRF